MLEKMGFTGRLGKHEQGIAQPVMAKLRPKGTGIAFGDFKENEGDEQVEERNRKEKEEARAKAAAAMEAAGLTPGAEAGAGAEGEGNWRRDAPEKRRKRVYKTAAELTADGAGGAGGAGSVAGGGVAGPQIVVDMRGPHVKVTSLDKISSASDAWTPTASARARETLPELQHNVRLLVDLTEVGCVFPCSVFSPRLIRLIPAACAQSDIHKLDRDIKHSKSSLLTLSQDR
jgi:tuftelin-interacting protein 11